MNTLKPGNYMNVGEVADYFHHINTKSTLVDIIRKIQYLCPVYNNYYNTQDIKSVMGSDLFKELECNVITHMVIEGQ